MSEVKLKCCPFCGGEAKLFKTHEGEFGIIHISETSCTCPISDSEGFQGDFVYDNKEEAIAAWNARKPIEEIVERLENKALEHAINGQQYGADGWSSHERTEILQQEIYEKAIQIIKGVVNI